jgi:hypothetical protein
MTSGKFHLFASTILLGIGLVLIPHTAHAYLDPGTGSYILQMIIAGILGAAFTIKMFWIRIKGFFEKMFSRDGTND